MTWTISTEEADTQLAGLLEKVITGRDEILITRAGIPVARLTPVLPAAPRVPGIDAGHLIVPDDIVSPLPDEETAEFYK